MKHELELPSRIAGVCNLVAFGMSCVFACLSVSVFDATICKPIISYREMSFQNLFIIIQFYSPLTVSQHRYKQIRQYSLNTQQHDWISVPSPNFVEPQTM